MTIHIHQEKSVHQIEIEKAGRLIDLLRSEGMQIDAPCGGNGTCGKCLVRTDNSASPSENEKKRLSQAQIAEGWRLACCTDIHDDMHVYIEKTREAVVQIDGPDTSHLSNPVVTIERFSLSPPTLSDPRDNWERVAEQFPVSKPSTFILPDIKNAYLPDPFLVLFDKYMALALKNGKAAAYGVAFDIGTTTVVGYLVDLLSGQTIDVISGINAQRAHGADVITRANFAAKGEGLRELASSVRTQISGMIHSLAERNSLCTDAIYHLSFAGNTIMMHLLLELPVGQITASPFAPLITCGMDIPAHELEFLPKRAIATILPSISGYVGADTVSAILSCGMMEKSETALLIDIGTNGEIVLTHENKLLCCSAAAGPAFEGAHIACGMGGVEGAISHVRTSNGRISFEVIGDGEPVGICGSGLVDAVAALLSIGALDETGRFDSEACPESNFLLDGKPAVRISENVYLTQRDVREVQLAKAAIAAGIEILLLEAGITVEQIQCVYLAGGFGSHIDPASACRIGILPTSALPHIRVVGNAAGSGARAALLDRNIRKKADDVRTKVKYIELSVHADFQDHFIEQMMFS